MVNFDEPDWVSSWNEKRIVFVEGGHYTPQQIRDRFPNGFDDEELVSVEAHGYMRYEFVSEYDSDDFDGQKQMWIWHTRPIKGVVRKATKVRVKDK